MQVSCIDTLHIMFAEMFYTDDQVPLALRGSKPLLLSPSNPYCNLMNGFKPDAQKVFSQAAAATLQKLTAVDETSIINPCDIFCVQPTETKSNVPHRSMWLVGEPEDSRLSQPVMKVRKPVLEGKHIFPTIKMCLTAYLHAAVIESGYHADPDQFIRRKVVQFIHDVFDEEESDWLSTEGNHGDYDVTFEIPIIKEGRAILISCKWREGTK